MFLFQFDKMKQQFLNFNLIGKLSIDESVGVGSW